MPATISDLVLSRFNPDHPDLHLFELALESDVALCPSTSQGEDQ
jgi:hypothetical protein